MAGNLETDPLPGPNLLAAFARKGHNHGVTLMRLQAGVTAVLPRRSK